VANFLVLSSDTADGSLSAFELVFTEKASSGSSAIAVVKLRDASTAAPEAALLFGRRARAAVMPDSKINARQMALNIFNARRANTL
jgi:hypothetical protein